MSDIKLRAAGISKAMSGVPVIENISLELHRGETVSMLGRSGTGKSTLLNILSGILGPDAGEVLIDGADAARKPGRAGYMHQKDLLLPHKRVDENVALPLVIKGERASTALRRARELLGEFGLAGESGKYPSQLSGGSGSAPLCCAPVFSAATLCCSTSPFPRWTPSPAPRCACGIWIPRAASGCPPSSSRTI